MQRIVLHHSHWTLKSLWQFLEFFHISPYTLQISIALIKKITSSLAKQLGSPIKYTRFFYIILVFESLISGDGSYDSSLVEFLVLCEVYLFFIENSLNKYLITKDVF